MRAFALCLALALAPAGCGSDNTTTPIGADLSVAGDLSGGPKSCGVDGVMLSCASVSGTAPCYICNLTSGMCAHPCLLAAPSCPTGQQCHELVTTGDGGAPPVSVEGGTGCGQYGYCR